MKGTEKQIRWAEGIKEDAIATCEANITRNAELFPELADAYRISLTIINAFFAKVDDAAVIIDKRGILAPDRIIRQAKLMEMQIKSGKRTAAQIAAENGVTL